MLNRGTRLGSAAFLMLSVVLSIGQETGELERIRRQLEEATRSFETTIKEQRRVIGELEQRLDALQKHGPDETHGKHAEPSSLEGQHDHDHDHDLEPEGLPGAKSPGHQIDLSLAGLFAVGTSSANDLEALQLGGHDPNQRGFTVQNVEVLLSGNVDPYLRGQANLIFQIDRDGETVVELEEVYGETLSLPWNLQLKAGQYFTEFGLHNPTHPHTWATVDQPLVAGRFFGPDGLRNPGARLSWLPPTPFRSALYLSVQDSQGETAESFRSERDGDVFLGRVHDSGRVESPGDLLFVPRFAAAFELTEAQTLKVGGSAALGPNASGDDTDTQIYGVDLDWTWRPPHHEHGYPFVSWQTEGLLRRYEAGAFSEDIDGDTVIDVDVDGDGLLDAVPRETLTDYGFYSLLRYGFKEGWVAGFRGGYVARSGRGRYETEFGDDPDRADRWRLSPSLTWHPSHYTRLRLQYNYDRRDLIGEDHSIWLQFEFLMGAHANHSF